MSAYEIHTAGRAPVGAEENTAFHAGLIDDLKACAREYGWQGAGFCAYRRERDIVSIGIAPAEAWPGLEELRNFREAQRQARLAAEKQAQSTGEQGQLI